MITNNFVPKSSARMVLLTAAAAVSVSVTGCTVQTTESAAPQPKLTGEASPIRVAAPFEMTGASNPANEQLVKDQARLTPYLDQITGPTYSKGLGAPGLGGVQVDMPKRLVTFAWKGTPPPTVKASLSAPPRGFTVRMINAAYSRAQLSQAATKLVASQVRTETGTRWTQVGLQPDGSGLLVQVYASGQETSNNLQSFAPAYTQAAGGIPVAISQGAPPKSAVGTLDESKAFGYNRNGRWNAGASGSGLVGGAAMVGRLDGTNRSFCTTGFNATTPAGQRVATTADHCQPGAKENGNGSALGNQDEGVNEHDNALLNWIGGPEIFGAGTYGGNWDGISGPGALSYSVGGLSTSYNGSYTCAGGAASGLHCNVVILNDWTYYEREDQEDVYPAVYVRQIDDGLWSNGGDSGGSVWQFMQDGRVSALGMVSANDANPFFPDPDCGSLAPGIGEQCSIRGWYVPMTTAIEDYGLQLKQS